MSFNLAPSICLYAISNNPLSLRERAGVRVKPPTHSPPYTFTNFCIDRSSRCGSILLP